EPQEAIEKRSSIRSRCKSASRLATKRSSKRGAHTKTSSSSTGTRPSLPSLKSYCASHKPCASKRVGDWIELDAVDHRRLGPCREHRMWSCAHARAAGGARGARL